MSFGGFNHALGLYANEVGNKLAIPSKRLIDKYP